MSQVMQNLPNLLKILEIGTYNPDEGIYYSKKFNLYLTETQAPLSNFLNAGTPYTLFNCGVDITGQFYVIPPFMIPIKLIQLFKSYLGQIRLWQFTKDPLPKVLLELVGTNIYFEFGDAYLPFEPLESKELGTLIVKRGALHAIIRPYEIEIMRNDEKISEISFANMPSQAHEFMHVAELMRVLPRDRNTKLYLPTITKELGTRTYYLISPEYLGFINLGKNSVFTIGGVYLDAVKTLEILNQLGVANLPPAQWPISFIIPHNTGAWYVIKAYIKLNTRHKYTKYDITGGDELIELPVVAPPLAPESGKTREIQINNQPLKLEYKNDTFRSKWIINVNNQQYIFDTEDANIAYKKLLLILSSRYNL